MEHTLTQADNAKNEKITLSDALFGYKFNQALVHQVITACMAAGRQGSKAQKTRAEVSGGGIKPWRQKGTGRARAGTIRSPIWRKGGVTFAAKPRDYSQKVNKKMYKNAMRSIFSELVKQDRFIVVKDFSVNTPKTKDLVEKLNKFNLQDVLILTDQLENNLQLASRNLPHVDVTAINNISPIDLIAFDKVMITLPALKQLEESLT